MTNLKKSSSHDVGLPPLLSKSQGYSVETPSSENYLQEIMESSRTPQGTYSTKDFKKKLGYTFLPDVSEALRQVIETLPDEDLTWDQFTAKVDPIKIMSNEENAKLQAMKKKTGLIKRSPSTDIGLPPLLAKSQSYSIEPPTPQEKLTSIMEFSSTSDGKYSMKTFKNEVSNADFFATSEKLKAAVDSLGDDDLTWSEFVAKVNPSKIFVSAAPSNTMMRSSTSNEAMRPRGLPTGNKTRVKKSPSQDVNLAPLAAKSQLYSVEPPTKEERLGSIMEYAKTQEGKYSMKIFKKEIENSDLLEVSENLKKIVISLDDDEMLTWNEFSGKVDPVKVFASAEIASAPEPKKKGHSRTGSLKSSPSMDLNLPPLVNRAQGYSVDPPSQSETLYSIMEYAKTRDGTYSMKLFLKEIEDSTLNDSPELKEALKAIDLDANIGWDEFCELINPVKIFAQQ